MTPDTLLSLTLSVAAANWLAAKWRHLPPRVVSDWQRRLGRRLQPADFDDAVSVATVCLVGCSRRYDPARGVRFPTYARRAIWHELAGFLCGERLVRVPPMSYRADSRGARESAAAPVLSLTDPDGRAGPATGPDEQAARRDDAVRLHAALGRLEAGDADLLRALYFRHEDWSAAAARLGVTHGTLGGCRARALREMRHLLGEAC